MSVIIHQIQNTLEKCVGHSIAEISINASIGIGAGYLLMRFAKSSAFLAGTILLGIEVVGEHSSIMLESGGKAEENIKIILGLFTLDEVYRRCAARGFVGGFLIGMTMA